MWSWGHLEVIEFPRRWDLAFSAPEFAFVAWSREARIFGGLKMIPAKKFCQPDLLHSYDAAHTAVISAEESK